MSARAAFVPRDLASALAELPGSGPYVVAYSGGRDSLALLRAFVALRDAGDVLAVRAMHVDHALHDDSAGWAACCRDVCARLDVPFTSTRVDASARAGESPEAAARDARYAALRAGLHAGEVLCTAHHAGDQAESVMLALARGGGPRGLAGIAPWRRFDPGWLARPVLGVSPGALAAFALESELPWVLDPSNDDPRFARSFVRHRVLPGLLGRWPGLVGTLARVARLQREAAEMLDIMGEADLARAAGHAPGTLSRARCIEVDAIRVRNLLRIWVARRGLPLPGARHLERVVADVLHAAPDATPVVTWPGAEIRAYRDAVHLMAPLEPVPNPQPLAWRTDRPLRLPGGTLRLQEGARGLGAEHAFPAVEVRYVGGGERCRPVGRRHSQTLKRLFQEHAVPPWLRPRTPLLYRDGALVAVAGLWVCAGYQAGAGERGWWPEWQRQDAAGATHGAMA